MRKIKSEKGYCLHKWKDLQASKKKKHFTKQIMMLPWLWGKQSPGMFDKKRKLGTDLHECSWINRLQFASISFSGSPKHSCRGFLYLYLLEDDESFCLQYFYILFQIRVLDRFRANRLQINICPLIQWLSRRIIDEYFVKTIKAALFPYSI